ncbi:Uncharacterised protein [Escherichia coli]|jgi:hypothetical protein|nr:Uncharacterised protein [Escherichia coli]
MFIKYPGIFFWRDPACLAHFRSKIRITFSDLLPRNMLKIAVNYIVWQDFI